MFFNERYLPANRLPDLSHLEVLNTGYSVKSRPIELYRLGEGSYKIFAWSQMHGNESTTTRALLNTIKILEGSEFSYLKDIISLYFIIQLNPDGSYLYTRENAVGVDLNRDANDMSQPESRFLRSCFEDIDPNLCLNLHDQRTLFSAGDFANEATVSFLAPSGDPNKTFTDQRRKAIGIILKISRFLKEKIPGKVGRYDDAFNINCTGDMFTSMGKPVILFEAGHYRGDYRRDRTRNIISEALVKTLEYAPKTLSASDEEIENYLRIPENKKKYFDIVVRNFEKNNRDTTDLGIMFREVLDRSGCIGFVPYLKKEGDLSDFYGHLEFLDKDFINSKIKCCVSGNININSLFLDKK